MYSQRQARENVCGQVTIGFGLSFDWSRKGREICKPITKRSNAKLLLTQLKTPIRAIRTQSKARWSGSAGNHRY